MTAPPVFALTMETAQVWAFLILTGASALGSLISAVYAARAKANSGAVKAAIGTEGTDRTNGDKKTPTIQQQVQEIHAKADTAIEQNKSIEKQTDGHYSALTDLLSQLVEAMKERPAVVAVPTDPPPPRQVRKEDLQRAADAGKKDPT